MKFLHIRQNYHHTEDFETHFNKRISNYKEKKYPKNDLPVAKIKLGNSQYLK